MSEGRFYFDDDWGLAELKFGTPHVGPASLFRMTKERMAKAYP